jgi:hypothetical protein
MIKLTESSKSNQVKDALNSGEVRCFTDLPECFQTPDMAIYYLQHFTKYSDVNSEFQYNTVPKHCRTDAFLMTAATIGCRVLRDTTPEDTEIYRDLAVATIGVSRLGFKDVPPAFRDVEMVECIIRKFPREIHSMMGRVDWLIDAMSDDQLDRCCQEDLMVALDAPAHRIKGSVSQYLHLDKLTGTQIVNIRSKGRLDLIALKLKEEKWPFPLFGAEGESMPIEPESMEKLLGRLEDSGPNTPYETIYMACMMREPIDQVVSLMASNRLKKLLLEMYSEAELAPYLKDDNQLKGAYLEDALGI